MNVERSCQFWFMEKEKKLFDYLTKHGVIADWREPNVIRIAPVPIYNSFEDCYRFSEVLNSAVEL